jgi:hypothetical protein
MRRPTSASSPEQLRDRDTKRQKTLIVVLLWWLIRGCVDSTPLFPRDTILKVDRFSEIKTFDKDQQVYVEEFELTHRRGSIDRQMEFEICQVRVFEMRVSRYEMQKQMKLTKSRPKSLEVE